MIQKGQGEKAILMLHGRGGDAENIITLAEFFKATSYAITANNNEWYPQPFMKPRKENQPNLNENLEKIDEIIKKLKKTHKEVFILGFSQGACLALEYGTKHEVTGIIAFSGGLIGTDEELQTKTKTKKILICCSEKDPFIPIDRAKKTQEIYEENGAEVKTNFYGGTTHTITREDIEIAKEIINN